MRKINPIFIVLGLSVLLILLTEFIKAVRENVFYALLGLLIVSCFIFWRKKQREDLYFVSFIFLAFLISRLIFNGLDQPTLVLRTASILAFTLLSLVLLIGPWSRFSDKVIRIYHFRRHLGVSVFLLGWLHFAIVISQYFDLSIQNALSSIFVFYGFTAFSIMFWMAVTSWDYVQKKVKPFWWKIAHAALLVIYLGNVYFFYTIQKAIADPTLKYHLIVIGFFILFWILVAPYSIINKIMKTYVFGWKQLHVLLYIAYFSLVLHVLFGALTTQGLALKSIFYASVAFVLGSHAAGWIKKIREDSRIYSKIRLINIRFTEEGKEFIGVAKVNELAEGIGKKTYINKRPVALFKYGNNFFAISNTCKHQKGPIYKGKIEYGVVECPWHHWTYRLEDGCFPGKEKDCLPVYETRVKDGILFVGPQAIKKD